MGHTTKYYQDNPKARKKKKAYDTKLNGREEQIKKRVESNRDRIKAKKNGKNVKGKDYDHKTHAFISIAKNRGRKGEGGRV